ncbi:YeiH family protein [Nocardioides donggukensis]|uniref:Sulfate exporter family transporter n=1 Tax=Nocardioides donggukensis TaxID=2774019 RepID=A0A927K1C9_9ACTN|nr:putative sulfate exporter family transporter [Nocardioides donggukensis]MBD8868392.1 putative sulfate exporter family transporter [Nocardioides donggukensis]
MTPSTSAAPPRLQQGAATAAPGVTAGLWLASAGVLAAVVAHRLLPQVGVLTFAVLFGAALTNLGLLPASAAPGLRLATRTLLRAGVVLLGFSLPLGAIVALGAPVVGLVVVTLLTTLAGTFWLGTRLGLGRPRSLLIATGFSICGASAIAGMQRTAEADEDDVALAVAMVTVWGTAAMVAVPLLQGPLGLDDAQLGVWAGAGVHEVGQVVAAAGPAGAAAVAIATVVKLTRVLMLAPVVAGVAVLRRRELARGSDRRAGSGASAPLTGELPPLVPAFVVGFLACSLLRTAGLVPDVLFAPVETLQTLTLGAALFGLGTAVRLAGLVRASGPALVLSGASTLIVAGVSLAGVLLVV